MSRLELIKNHCFGKVLDLGSHNEKLHDYLKKNNIDVYGADIQGQPDFFQDLNKPQWSDIFGQFDTIVAGEIIEHVENPTLFIKNCKKNLKINGRLIVTTPNATSLIHIYNPSWCNPVHLHTFTKPMIEYLLRREGFVIKKSLYLNEFMFNPFGFLMAQIIPRLRGDLFIMAEI